jgi:hypothetical protein
MKIIYIAGPMRGKNHWEVAQNVRNAEYWGFEVAKAGHMPLIPHCIGAHFDGTLTGEFWLEGTAELLRRCDGAVFIPGWPRSSGSNSEFTICAERKIPVCDLDGPFAHSTEIVLSKWFERYSRHGVER